MTDATCCANDSCGRAFRPGEKAAAGYCSTCASRWYARGRPPEGPGLPGMRGEKTRQTATAARQDRLAETVRLAGAGTPPAEVCARVGISRSTFRQYLADYRASGGVIDVMDLRAAAEQARPAQEARPPAAAKRATTHWNGRELEPWEVPIIAAGHAQAAAAEKAMLGEKSQRKVA